MFLPGSGKTLWKYSAILNNWVMHRWLTSHFASYFKFSAIFLAIAHKVIMKVKNPDYMWFNNFNLYFFGLPHGKTVFAVWLRSVPCRTKNSDYYVALGILKFKIIPYGFGLSVFNSITRNYEPDAQLKCEHFVSLELCGFTPADIQICCY